MKEKHLTDHEIQEHAFDGSANESAIIKHLQSCDMCSLKVENYKQLIFGIKEQPEAGFDFDLSALVISQIAQKQVGKSYTYLFWFLGIFGITAAIVGVLLGEYGPAFFFRLSGMGFYLVIVTASILLIFLGIDVYQKHKRQWDMIDFY